jgi:hypothetical protein
MPRIHRLEHVEAFCAAHFAYDDSIGPHAQRVANQVALRHFAPAFDVRRASFQTPDMWLLELQLG